MDLITGLQTFVRVVETGSFSAVARESSTSQSAVTRQVAQLEDHFGVRLFHRTTRKLSLTDDGQELIGRARHLLEEAGDLEDSFGRNGNQPRGLVRVGVSVGAAMLLVPEFTLLLHRNPGLSIQLVVNEQIDDLVEERLDLALRVGQSPDISLVSRAVATLGWSLVAAPAYLEGSGAPSHPADLSGHRCIIQDIGSDSSTHWVFNGSDGAVEVEVTSAFRCNNTLVARQAVLSGYGIAMFADAVVADYIRSGRLVRLLPDFPLRARQAFIVYPSRRHLAQRTRLVIDFLVEQFRKQDARLRDGRYADGDGSAWLV